MIKVLLAVPSLPLQDADTIAFSPVWLPCTPRSGEKVAGDLGIADKLGVDFVVHNVGYDFATVVLKGIDKKLVKKQIGKNGWIRSSSDAVWPEKK